MEFPRIDGARLWGTLMESARIGATEKGGLSRLALSDEDKRIRDLFTRWCEEAGMTLTIDRLGSMFARRPGADASRLPVMIGSHLDTQPSGGRFDGIFGVLSGLEVVRTLNDHGIATEAPVELVNWTNEEGSRFQPAMLASGVFAGVDDLDAALAATDLAGFSVSGELERIGYAGTAEVGNHPAAAYFEPHIEQGPILEDEGITIGVVTGVQGQRWYEITLSGVAAHAGPTPMSARRDAMVGAARIIGEIRRIGLLHPPLSCSTVGLMVVHPNSRNVIPGEVMFSADLRHPDADVLASMDAEFQEVCARIAGEERLELDFRQIWYAAPQPYHERCIGAVRDGAARLGFSHRDIVSGAGHDAVHIAKVIPTGMIFIPCENGISHNEAENVEPEHASAGCDVLLHAVLEHAGRVGG